MKAFEFEIPAVIRAACSALTYINGTCDHKSQAWVSPPVVDGGSRQSQHIIGDDWRVNEPTPFDAVVNVVLFSSAAICSVLTEQSM